MAPPVTESSTAHPTNSAVKERGDEEEKEEEEEEEKGSGGGMAEKGEEGVHDSMSVQQILMPPDSDFLSSFYEAAQARTVWTVCVSKFYANGLIML